MVVLLDLVQHNEFKFSHNYKDLTKTLQHVILLICGVSIDISKNCPLSSIAKVIQLKFKKRKVSKEKFLKLEKSWLATKYIEVCIP
jgi:hypothetical protein